MIYLRLVITEHQPANRKLCLLSEEILSSLIVDFDKTILAAFNISYLVRHPKNKTKQRTNNVLFTDYSL